MRKNHRFLIALAALLALSAAACGEDEAAGPEEGLQNNGAANNGDPFTPLPDPEPGNWLAFRADAQRTGHNPEADTGRTVRELWRVEDINTTEYGAAKGSPSVYGDTLYVGSDDARFGAYDRHTGQKVWDTVIPETTQGIHGSPALSQDMAYIGAYNGTIYAFDRESGEQRWSYQKGFQIGASPLFVAAHGRVYCSHEQSSTGGGFVVSVDALTGAEVWAYRIRAHPHSSVALHEGKNVLVVGDNLALLHGFDASTGEKLWEVQLPQPNEDDGDSDIKSTPTVLEALDLVAVGAWSKYVHAYNIQTGALAWETYAGARIMSSAAYAPGRKALYVGMLSPGNGVLAVDATNGQELWRFDAGASILSSPAVSGDESLVVVGAGNGMVYALDADSGQEVWRHEVGGAVTGSPALVGSHVYITARQGDLVALETGE
jgi:outer membrane protein assembly factor BamB